MSRFFVFPLLSSLGALLESAFCLLSASFCWSGLFFPVAMGTGPFRGWDAFVRDYQRAASDLVFSRWPYLIGASVLLGLGMAGYEIALYRQRPLLRSAWGLVQNIFWFGAYAWLFSLPALFMLPMLVNPIQNNGLQQLLNMIIEISFPLSGFIIVLLAGIYSVNSNQVFSPKAIVRRIRHGRLNTSAI